MYMYMYTIIKNSNKKPNNIKLYGKNGKMGIFDELQLP